LSEPGFLRHLLPMVDERAVRSPNRVMSQFRFTG
jgi:hypothetical protein